MIFVTVGHQMPFDRLVRAVDSWAAATGRKDVFAQIGATQLRPENIEWTQFLDPADYKARMRRADAMVAHAGTGSIIASLELGKPILVMPRRAALRETRNDHQIATARRFQEQGRVLVAAEASELPARLAELEASLPVARIERTASPELIARLRAFIDAL